MIVEFVENKVKLKIMLNIKKISALASFTVVTTSVLTNIQPSQALTLAPDSTINIAGDVTLEALGVDSPFNGEPLSTLDFLNFDGTSGDGTGEFVITGGTLSFADFAPSAGLGFQTGTIVDLPDPEFPFGDPRNADPATQGFVPTENFLVFSDQLGNIVNFDLVTLGAPEYTTSGGSTSVTIGATGNFDTDMQTDVPGSFVFAAEFVDLTGAEVRSILRTEGGILVGESNSGNGIVGRAVPEPSSMISLIALGLAGAGFLTGKKKQKQIS